MELLHVWSLLAGIICVVFGEHAEDRFLSLPVLEKCNKRFKEATYKGRNFFYSGHDPELKDQKTDWLDSRNTCRERCMETITFEEEEKFDFFKEFIVKSDIKFVWTSGRVCDFAGCEGRWDLLPKIKKGWLWSSNQAAIHDTSMKPPGWSYQPWSHTGIRNRSQPDNGEFYLSQIAESCLVVLNNMYNDSVAWHDAACYHRGRFICEDSEELYKEAQEIVAQAAEDATSTTTTTQATTTTTKQATTTKAKVAVQKKVEQTTIKPKVTVQSKESRKVELIETTVTPEVLASATEEHNSSLSNEPQEVVSIETTTEAEIFIPTAEVPTTVAHSRVSNRRKESQTPRAEIPKTDEPTPDFPRTQNRRKESQKVEPTSRADVSKAQEPVRDYSRVSNTQRAQSIKSTSESETTGSKFDEPSTANPRSFSRRKESQRVILAESPFKVNVAEPITETESSVAKIEEPVTVNSRLVNRRKESQRVAPANFASKANAEEPTVVHSRANRRKDSRRAGQTSTTSTTTTTTTPQLALTTEREELEQVTQYEEKAFEAETEESITVTTTTTTTTAPPRRLINARRGGQVEKKDTSEPGKKRRVLQKKLKPEIIETEAPRDETTEAASTTTVVRESLSGVETFNSTDEEKVEDAVTEQQAAEDVLTTTELPASTLNALKNFRPRGRRPAKQN